MRQPPLKTAPFKMSLATTKRWFTNLPQEVKQKWYNRYLKTTTLTGLNTNDPSYMNPFYDWLMKQD